MKTSRYLWALLLIVLFNQSALAQLDGIYSVRESWTLHVHNGYTGGTNVFSGTYTGTVTVSNGIFATIDKTGLASDEVVTDFLSDTYTNSVHENWMEYDGSNFLVHGDYPAGFI